tara:strand:- start:8887 stop:9729 length:843 start_codon:yes stop_codon:yes gene_type:complete
MGSVWVRVHVAHVEHFHPELWRLLHPKIAKTGLPIQGLVRVDRELLDSCILGLDDVKTAIRTPRLASVLGHTRPSRKQQFVWAAVEHLTILRLFKFAHRAFGQIAFGKASDRLDISRWSVWYHLTYALQRMVREEFTDDQTSICIEDATIPMRMSFDLSNCRSNLASPSNGALALVGARVTRRPNTLSNQATDHVELLLDRLYSWLDLVVSLAKDTPYYSRVFGAASSTVIQLGRERQLVAQRSFERSIMRTSCFFEELMQAVWRPDGRMFQYYMIDEAV